MGSDMAMESRNFSPRSNYAEWDGDDLVIYKDVFSRGYTQIWKGEVTDSNYELILTWVNNIPSKPAPVIPLEDKIASTLAADGLLRSEQRNYAASLIKAVLETHDG